MSLVMGTKTKPVTGTQYQRHIYETSSPMSRRNEMRLFHARLSTTRIRNGHQTTTVTITSHRPRENDCFSGPTIANMASFAICSS
jgi:hypothetical protein